ncbi:hypothetical protein JX265_006719 [Neoarthrinium moseri]|uniref:Uncharacterized protein n=1 Tax=Neoarthrinium moseri TaxID=1658444 RepID=A0A9Q0AQS8_9PEZI|nr:hypothetical protein JX265_006719 [Neoarthrinium moseri]
MKFDDMYGALQRADYQEILKCGRLDDTATRREFLTRRTVGKAPREPTYTFDSRDEYFATLSVEARITQELEERDQRKDFECTAMVQKLSRHNRPIFIAMLSKVKKETAQEIGKGDNAEISWKLPGDSTFKAGWKLKFNETIPGSRPDELVGTLEEGGILAKEGQKQKWGPLIFKVNIIPRHSRYVYIWDAQQRLQSPGRFGVIMDFLLAKDLEKNVRTFNIYHGLGDQNLVKDEVFQLNESQLKAINLARHAPAGFVLVQGGPGTGKTHFATEAVLPFFRDTKKHHLLLTSAGNRGADAMAEALYQRTKYLIGNGISPGAIVRLHSIKTEISIFLRPARMARYGTSDDPQISDQARGKHKDETTMLIEHFASTKFAEVDDDRVQHLHLALGTRMQQALGLQKDGTFTAPTKYPALEVLYKRYLRGEKWTAKDQTLLEEESEILARHTISNATAICSTVAGAMDINVTRAYGSLAELIVVDEAARIPEYDWWPLIAFYTNARCKLMIGDKNQLPPFIGQTQRDNPFKAQIGLSLQERIQKSCSDQNLEWSGFFRTQYRAVPQVAQVYNQAFYGGRISSGISLESRTLAKQIVGHNKKYYGGAHDRSVLFANLPEARNQQDHSSRYCDLSAAVILNILERLLKDGFGTTKMCSMAILVPYHAQRKRLKAAMAKMAIEFPATAHVVLETGDTVQGREFDVVLLDPVVTSSPGFLNKNRLNVLVSRARDGLYVVGNSDQWDRMLYEDSQPLKAIRRQLLEFGVTWTGDQTSRFYDPETFRCHRDAYDSD